MIKQIIISLCCTIISTSIYAQNLLSDGSFELINNSSCVSPELGFNESVLWYTIQGTPDLFSNNCNLPEFEEIFWSKNAKASDGQNFIGLRCRVNSNQSYISEGVASKLAHSLDPQKTYYISMNVRNKGFYQGFPNSTIDCPLTPEKKIEIYTHTDSIKIDNNFSNGSASANGTLANIVESPLLQSDKVSDDWFVVGTCFTPVDEASYLAVIMPLGNFGTFPECAADDTKGTFYSYYYEFDDIIVDTLASEIEVIKYLANGQKLDIYLPEEIELPIINNATMQWEDGYIGSRRSIAEPGDYTIEAIFDCGSIMILLEVIAENKEFPFFIPNVFSPNNDGINDEFEVFIPADKPILEYKLEVFDRWGNRVFRSNDINDRWKGEHSNHQFLSGDFLYYVYCEVAEKSGVQKYSKSGNISILR
ncbi:T9SS type B sorting domain-containing protein [Portibacter lacus]|uniref:Gliding motility-associated C-terminal domain-containing protein n=1 Tax=Portibacter lacus TaxID=1099794 RepID=A0AA37SRU0_9BACT|nr:gliding motility-associated C-terminal domain-containing protein [Portibacter lacus]GLR19666.1 hypothetical protein GCM10007940_42820 [Portibacter lacus]